MYVLEKLNRHLNRTLVFIGGVFLVSMVALTCANIVFRLTWVPIRGTYELMGFFGALVTAFALGHTQLKKGHIAVDVLINTFPPKTRRTLSAVNGLICLFFFGIAAWQIAVKATTLMKTGEITETLRIIYYPFTYAVAFGCAVLVLVLFTDLLAALIPAKENRR